MTPEGYKAIVDAMDKEERHSSYLILPEPLEGEDLEYVTISRRAPTQQIIPALVLNSLARANLLKPSEDSGELPELSPVDFQYGSVTLRDLASKRVYKPAPGTTE